VSHPIRFPIHPYFPSTHSPLPFPGSEGSASLQHKIKTHTIKKTVMKKLLVLLVAATAVFTSCKKDNAEAKGGIFEGTKTTFQHGKAWTWVELNNEGNPLKVAVAIDAQAMNSLDTTHPGTPGHHHENNIVLDFHAKAGVTPFKHIFLGWNPQGHEPEFIYGLPHFDFHYYMTSSAERAAIPVYEADSAKFKNAPAPAYLPATYINPGGGAPAMGAHWLDVTSPELSGQPFTQTFIYGSYNGKVTFLEPMITEQFIKDNPSFIRSIPQPQKVQTTGWYPTKMRIETKNGVTNVILEEFVYKVQS
jgi:hypothetical protein